MSKRNMLLGLAAGKVGDLVFYRDGGEQRTRTRVVPKNPRSQAQMEQRVRIANVSATYRLLKSILTDSFTGRPSNQSGYNAFASSAIEISPYLTREMALADVCVPAPYIIARGTITPVFYEVLTSESSVVLSIELPSVTADSATVGEISAAFLAAYPQLQQGDVLTFVSVNYQNVVANDDSAGFRGSPTFVSLKLDTTDTTALSMEHFSVSAETLFFNAWGANEPTAAAMIISRVDGNGALQTSSAQLVLSTAASEKYSTFRTPSALYDATDSYGVGNDSLLRE